MSTHNIYMKVCCVFSLESPHLGLFSKGPKNEFKIAVVDEPSLFEPLKFYCFCCTKRSR